METRPNVDLEELIRDDFDDYLGGTRDFSQSAAYLNLHTNFCWQWSEDIGEICFSHIKLREGLSLSMGSALLHESVHINFGSWCLPLAFSYCASGNIQYTFNHEHGTSRWSSEPGQSIVTYLNEFTGWMDCPAHTPLQGLSIYVDPLLLTSLVDLEKDCLPQSICNVTQDPYGFKYHKHFTTSPAIDMAVHQILHCPYQGALQRLYLEGYTLALLTHTLAQLNLTSNAVREKAVIRPQDVERVKYARELIHNNLQNPPTLMELAKAVGLHHSKLNRGFREMYGTTTFGYLRQARLIMAKAFLDDGRMNVTETAFAVGYSSPSHLAKAFKDFYGTSPHAYLRTVSRKW